MKTALERVDLGSVVLDLDATGRVEVASAKAVHGNIERTDARLVLEGFGAEHVVLRALRLALGSVDLVSERGASIDGLGLVLDQRADLLDAAVVAVTIAATDLAIDAGDVVVRGQPTLSGVRLTIGPDGGSLSAKSIDADDLVVEIGGLFVEAPKLRAREMRIGWGTRGFELAVEAVDAPGLVVRGETMAFDAGPLVVEDVLVGPAGEGAAVRVARVVLERGAVHATLAPAADNDAEQAPAPSPAEPPVLDMCLLDFLSGKIDVDALIDVSVPILGHRRATHAFRVPVDGGTIDFRELEANLAALEDAILDFAFRDGALVLERKNPLLPVRGHGKPIVSWALDAEDALLAAQNRVRLSVLPKAKPVSSDSTPPRADDGKSGFALRELGLHRVAVDLSLSPVEARCVGRLRPKKIGRLAVEGQVIHTPDESSPEGRLVGDATDVELTVVGLDAGAQTVDVRRTSIAKIASFDVAFADVVPTAVKIDLEGAVIETLSIGPRA